MFLKHIAKNVFFFVSLISLCFSQIQPSQGLRNKTPHVWAITNAHIFITPSQKIENATLIIRNGLIESVGKGVAIPQEAEVIDAQLATIYPGFIEPFSEYGLPKNQTANTSSDWRPSANNNKNKSSNRHWNDAIHAEKKAANRFSSNAKKSQEFIKQGFTVAQTASLDGIFRGQSAVVLLGDSSSAILKTNHMQFASFLKGSSKTSYPQSLMGSIALIRQTLYDAKWYEKAQNAYANNLQQIPPQQNRSLRALNRVINGEQTILFSVRDELSLLRANNIAKEFGLSFVFKGSGHEYRRIQAIKNTNSSIIIPVDFPNVPDVATPENQFDVSLNKLKHWNTAKENAARLEKANVEFAFTSNGLKNRADFLKNIRHAVQHGLTKQKALEALTIIPAKLCGIAHQVGTLEKGKIANFIVANGDIFADNAKIYDVWVAGKKNTIEEKITENFIGNWEVKAEDLSFQFEIKGSDKEPKVANENKTIKIESIVIDGNKIQFQYINSEGTMRFSGRLVKEVISGIALSVNNYSHQWQAMKVKKEISENSENNEEISKTEKNKTIQKALFEVSFPNKAFGRKKQPEQPYTVFVKNATIWTAANQGTIENADMIVRQGKIEQVGKNLVAPPEAIIIEGKGIHVTPGIIDEHSHIAISRGVNEATEAVTAEVRIGDVVNSDDSNIYRQLAGGVTTSHLLHGSANPIGGQLQVIKLRWGALPQAMKMKDLPMSIKFALGENVKQSNWGERYTTRYPQTRMGVREIIYDVFQAAREYEKKHKNYNNLSEEDKRKIVPPRKDLELDAISDILNKRMFIHCHSYVQGEIISLARLANDFGFSVGTFTHVLEGYKVADKLKETGAMASSFSDWWAYKYEVFDAIPYNATLLFRQGVVVSINSDDAEMARRLNQEAAKSIKYGGLAPEEAIKLITINPAKQLYIDSRVGSLENGKDADFVVWNNNPLSSYARPLQTWVDGTKYFDIEEDRDMRKEVQRQKAALIQLAIDKKTKGEKVDTEPVKKEKHYHCDDRYNAIEGRD